MDSEEEKLEVFYDNVPHEFVNLESENYSKLPQIDKARVFLLKNNPTNEAVSSNSYTNVIHLKNKLKQTFHELDMDDPVALNKKVLEENEVVRR